MEQVVYICGYGRSGSTILDILLSQDSEVFGAGELCNLINCHFRNEYCACGQTIPDCPFWRGVLTEWKSRVGSDALERYSRYQRSFECRRAILSRAVAGNSTDEEFLKYENMTKILYEAIRNQSGKNIIVDSSKNPARLSAISGFSDVELRVIHLIRDVRGVAWSLAKPYKRDDVSGIQRDMAPRSVLRSGAMWNVHNLAAELIIKRGALRSTRIRYEDLVSRTEETVPAIGLFMARDLSGVRDFLSSGRQMAPKHTVAGNRVRMNKRLELNLDEEWKYRLSYFEKWMLIQVCRPLLGRYGYI